MVDTEARAQLSVDADLNNTTRKGGTNTSGVIYTWPDRSYANTLSLRLTFDDAISSVPRVSFPADPLNPAISLQFPEDVKVETIAATGFTQSAGGVSALCAIDAVPFDAGGPIDITLTGVTATGDAPGASLAVYLPGLSSDAVSEIRLSLLPRPAPGDEPLPLLPRATAKEALKEAVIYVTEQDLTKVPGDLKTRADFRREFDFNKVLLSICSGVSRAVPAVPSLGWHLRISFDFGNDLGDLLTPASAPFVQPVTTRDYRNGWQLHEDRQASWAAFEYTAQGGTFLSGGSNNKMDLMLEGLFPNGKEGYGNIYIEYRHLEGYRAGMAIVPVYKKRAPAIDRLDILANPRAGGGEVTGLAPDQYQVIPLSEGPYKGFLLFDLAWSVRNADSVKRIALLDPDAPAAPSLGDSGLLAAADRIVSSDLWEQAPVDRVTYRLLGGRKIEATVGDDFGYEASRRISALYPSPIITLTADPPSPVEFQDDPPRITLTSSVLYGDKITIDIEPNPIGEVWSKTLDPIAVDVPKTITLNATGRGGAPSASKSVTVRLVPQAVFRSLNASQANYFSLPYSGDSSYVVHDDEVSVGSMPMGLLLAASQANFNIMNRGYVLVTWECTKWVERAEMDVKYQDPVFPPDETWDGGQVQRIRDMLTRLNNTPPVSIAASGRKFVRVMTVVYSRSTLKYVNLVCRCRFRAYRSNGLASEAAIDVSRA